MPRKHWSARLTRPISVKDGPVLRTLHDVRVFILDQSEGTQEHQSWQKACELLLAAALASRRRRSRNAPSRIRAVLGSSAATAGCSLPWPKMKNDQAVVVRWHSASFACGAEVWSLLDVHDTPDNGR